MDRVTSDLIAVYHEDFPEHWVWPDLQDKAKAEAERTNVDFMSLGASEMAMVVQTLRLGDVAQSPGRWVEIGSLTGYSALCLLSALHPQSQLWTLEKSPERCVFLRELFRDPRLGGRLHVVEGDSRDSKASLESQGPFDGIFLDGAKAEYLNDLDWSERHVKKGGWILADNVFLGGSVFDPQALKTGTDHHSVKQVTIMHTFLTRVSDSTRFATLMLPTSDGLSVSRKLF